MSEDDFRRCIDALWDNAIDGKQAAVFDHDFDLAEQKLADSFRKFLASYDPR